MTIDIIIILAAIIGVLSYFYNRGLEEMYQNTEQWQRELNALIEREKHREDEEDRQYQDKDNENKDK